MTRQLLLLLLLLLHVLSSSTSTACKYSASSSPSLWSLCSGSGKSNANVWLNRMQLFSRRLNVSALSKQLRFMLKLLSLMLLVFLLFFYYFLPYCDLLRYIDKNYPYLLTFTLSREVEVEGEKKTSYLCDGCCSAARFLTPFCNVFYIHTYILSTCVSVIWRMAHTSMYVCTSVLCVPVDGYAYH